MKKILIPLVILSTTIIPLSVVVSCEFSTDDKTIVGMQGKNISSRNSLLFNYQDWQITEANLQNASFLSNFFLNIGYDSLSYFTAKLKSDSYAGKFKVVLSAKNGYIFSNNSKTLESIWFKPIPTLYS